MTISGATVSRFSGGGGIGEPGRISPGTYSASVVFADGTQIEQGGIRVEAGNTTHLQCDDRFMKCKVSAPESANTTATRVSELSGGQ